MPTIIRQQWGALIRSNNIIKEVHIKKTLADIDADLFNNEIYQKFEIGINSNGNGDDYCVTIYGYGNRKNDDVKLFTREFRKYLRLHGHVLNGNVWYYGEKEHVVNESSNIENVKETEDVDI